MKDMSLLVPLHGRRNTANRATTMPKPVIARPVRTGEVRSLDCERNPRTGRRRAHHRRSDFPFDESKNRESNGDDEDDVNDVTEKADHRAGEP